MAATCLLLPLLILFPLVFFLMPLAYSMSQADALLKLKRSLSNAEALDSWVPVSEPCGKDATWVGLVCYEGIVTGLRLRGMGLSGKIDIDALTEISGLRTISFMKNSFSGPIPDFNRLGALKAIYLTENQFSGEIPPDYFANMGSLKKLWLSNNKFSGKIPPSVSLLSHLMELHLENNQFTGEIPSINISTLTSLNVANNALEGEIPSTLSKFSNSSFAGNPGLCGGKLGKECPKEAEQPAPAPAPSPVPSANSIGAGPSNGLSSDANQESSQSNGNKKIVIPVVLAGVVIMTLAMCLIMRTRRKANVQEDFNMMGHENVDEQPVQREVPVPEQKELVTSRKRTGSSRKGSNSTKGSGVVGDLVLLSNEKGTFGMVDLMKAAAEVLGNGGLGSSYKAVMSNGLTVVVKRIREVNGKGRDELDAEMRKIGGLKHPNVLPPLAYHCRNDEKLLVCEYIPKGSLLYLLHGDRGPNHEELNWPARLKIIKGIARGIGYLHSEFYSSNLPHGNLKSSNVLLNSDYEPLLSDYGYSLLLVTTNALQALSAYKAPEAAQFSRASPKCDVYCFGVVILEVLTGKFPSQYLNNGKGGTDVVEWVRSAISDRRGAEVLDPGIATCVSSLPDMEKLLYVGVACTDSSPDLRLDMREAIRRIEEIQIGEGQDSKTNAPTQSHVLSLRDGLGGQPIPRMESISFRDRSGCRDGNSFSFGIS